MMSVRNLKVFMLCFVAVCSVQYTNLHTQNWRTMEQQTDPHADTGPYIDVELLKAPTAVATTNMTNAVNNNNTTIFPNRTNNNNNNNNTPIVIDIESKESFLWRGAQSRLCARIKKTTKKQNSSQLLLKLNIPCFKIDRKQQHGNYMLGLYAMRLAAMSFRADFAFECQETEGKDSLMWWLQSKPNPPSVVDDDSLYTPRHPTKEIACKGMGRIGLHYVSEHVRKDFRAMALQIAASMEQQGRIIDDVAIHLRCGDILTKAISSKDSNYGLVHFEAYRKRIPNTAKSIGIVTAPFSEDHRRPQDHGSGTVCEELVSKLTHYLESHFPEATIKVRNDPKESIPEVVSRLVMAQHNFCVRSTFCLLPSIASFGSSYLQEGGVAYFVDEVSKAYENIHLMDEGFLLSSEIRKKGWNATLSWLVSNSTTQENP